MKSARYINNPNGLAPRRGRWDLVGWVLLLAIALLHSSCATNLYLQPGDLLVKGEPIFTKVTDQPTPADTTLRQTLDRLKELGLSTVDPDLLYSSVRTRPNRRMLLPKTYLHLYNLGRSLQRYEYAPERWLRFFKPDNHIVDSVAAFLVRTAGEPPNLIDTASLRRDAINLENVYFSQGFFHAKVYYRVDTCRSHLNAQKANVTYLIHEGPASIIDKVRPPLVEDEEMRKLLLRNMGDSYVRSGDNYNEDNFSAERARVATVMRNNGYFGFSPKMVYFDIDTLPPDTLGTLPTNEAIKEYQPIWVQMRIPDLQPRFRVGRVTMVIEPAEFDPALDQVMKVVSPGSMNDSLRHAWHLPRALYSDSSKITFVTYERVLARTNLNFLEKLVSLVEGEEYALSNERKTQLRLQNLGIFRYVLIKPEVDEETGIVDFTVQVVLLQRYSVKAGVEGFFENDPILKSNLPGVGAEIDVRDKLVFKGAERLDINSKGSIRFYRRDAGSDLLIFWEGAASASLQFPRIVSPGLAHKNIQGLDPSTNLIATFARQNSRDYVRNALSMDWNYRWYHSSVNKKAQSSLSPYVVTLVQSELGDQFVDRIKAIRNEALRTLIIQDFRPRFSSWGNYKFSYNGTASALSKHGLIFYGNFQVGGNTPFLIDRLAKVDDSWKDYKLDNIFYGQYFKLSLELKNNWRLNRHAAFVLRNFVGIAKPWNYTDYVPFDSRFFAGGANSMRGWQSNTLGPGTYSSAAADTSGGSGAGDGAARLNFLVSPGGELVFETNAELRFDVYKWIKMAIFSDAGNVWFLPGSRVDFPGSQISKSTFSQIGVDVGVGLRMDFDFFLFRVDFAKQLYAPDVQRIVIKSGRDDLGGNRFQLNFGIGYPF